MSTTAESMASGLTFPCLSLASLRERIGITLEEIAQSTRIAPCYLRAIEAEEFAKLPAGVYATSYIRQYARAIGYSEKTLLDEYHSRTAEESLQTEEDRPGPRVTTRLSEAICEARELFRWRSPVKPRTQHPV
jgi:cytoskeletal protein RodZ